MGLGLRILRDRILGARRPYFVWIMPTSRCNLRCRYCFGDFGNRPDRELTAETWEKIIDELARLGTRHISITGGEPMMRKDISRLVRRIRARGIECLLNSNGFQVPERIAELEGVDMMSISLDGTREINDAYRGEGTYEQAVRALASARSRGIPVQILMTLTGRFQEAYRHILELAEKYDCFIGMNILRPRLSADGREGMSVENYTQQARDFLDYLIRHRHPRLPYPAWLLKRFRDWPRDYEHCYIPKGESLGPLTDLPCISGRFMITIDPSGDLFGCARHCYRNPLANCADGDVERAWRNLESPPCRACLDFGWTLLNGACSFRPAFLWGLFRVMKAKEFRPAEDRGR